MSNALAIGAVSAVLKDLLNNGLIAHDLASAVGAVGVSARAPDLVATGANDPAQIILFLYRVSHNQGWRNQGQPERDSRGERTSNPPLALDLHYLLIAHGAQEFQAEILLGYAMQLLHENPVLGRESIRRALALPTPVSGSVLPPTFQALVAAELADQFESIRVVPEPLGIEELAKLWPMFDGAYRVTTGYQVSVVLIESKKSTRAALPVQKAKLYVLPSVRPTIETISAEGAGDNRITVASTLLVRGANLRGPITRLRIGEALAPPLALAVSDTLISLPLAGVIGLRAGATGAQVVHDIAMGEPEPGLPHRGTESNVVAFVLHPLVSAAPTQTPGSSTSESGVTFFSPTITVPINPAVGRKQRVTLLLNELNPPDTRPARAYSFDAPPDNGIADPDQPDTTSIAFAARRVAGGSYLVRIVIDGAESPLITGGDGTYSGPQVAVG